MNQAYVDTVRLLLTIAPSVFASQYFALKGGTALNLFVQDMPRLSVDIDVVFIDHTLERDAALEAISMALAQLQAALEARGFRATGLTLPVLNTAELYGSKLVAAMDRQHPRDIFDVVQMLARFGWQSSFVDCFVAYLAGHNRPVHEVLFPTKQPLASTFLNEFQGMTRDELPLALLEEAQQDLIDQLPRRLTPDHREFLLSLVRAEPVWELMPFEHLSALPALRWKLLNLKKLRSTNAKRFVAQHSELQARFHDLDATA